MIIVCSMALSFLLAGCASSSDTEVDLPEADNVESIQLQFCDDSCTVSEIVDITDDNKTVYKKDVETLSRDWLFQNSCKKNET